MTHNVLPEGDGLREAVEGLRQHLSSLDAAAIPTKSEVFVLCGMPARQLYDAIETVTAALSSPAVPQPNTIAAGPCEGSVKRNEDAVEGMRWCLHSGRYCKRATVQACPASPAAGQREAVAREAMTETLELRNGHPEGSDLWWGYENQRLGMEALWGRLSAIQPPDAVDERGRDRAVLAEIAAMMEKHVENWPNPKKLSTAIALIDKTIASALNQVSPEAYDRAPKHHYWGAGEPDCPREIKAGNGELHTLRCKVCGLDDPRNPICHADQHFDASAIRDGVRS